MGITQVALILALATFIEGFTEYLFSGLSEKSKPYLKYVALVFGVLVAFAYQIDILAMFGAKAIAPWVGHAVSGVILGRGSNVVNDIISFLREFPNRAIVETKNVENVTVNADPPPPIG